MLIVAHMLMQLLSDHGCAKMLKGGDGNRDRS